MRIDNYKTSKEVSEHTGIPMATLRKYRQRFNLGTKKGGIIWWSKVDISTLGEIKKRGKGRPKNPVFKQGYLDTT